MRRAAIATLIMLESLAAARAQPQQPWRDLSPACLYVLTPRGALLLRSGQEARSECPPEPVSLNCLVFDPGCITRRPLGMNVPPALSPPHLNPVPLDARRRR
jgi:hypothetical protein